MDLFAGRKQQHFVLVVLMLTNKNGSVLLHLWVMQTKESDVDLLKHIILMDIFFKPIKERQHKWGNAYELRGILLTLFYFRKKKWKIWKMHGCLLGLGFL